MSSSRNDQRVGGMSNNLFSVVHGMNNPGDTSSGQKVKSKTGPRFPVAVVDSKRCTACGVCEESCPVEAITVTEVARVDETMCVGCALCAMDCGEEAISMKRVI